MTWEGEAPPGRLTKRQRTWRAKRSVRVLGTDGIPPVENPAGTAVMDGPANVLEASQYRDPLAVYEAPRPLTREDLARAADRVRNARPAYDFPRVQGEEVDMWRTHMPLVHPPGSGPMLINADGRAYTPEAWHAVALAAHAVAEFLQWGGR